MKKNLAIGLITYFAVLFYFFGSASQWNLSVFVKIINPSLIIDIIVLAGFCFLASFLLKARSKRPLLSISIGLLAVGIIAILLQRMQPNISILAGYDVVNFGTAVIGIAIAFLGLDIARESDNKMKAIANLQFDGKVDAMENYMDEFSDPSFNSSSLEPEYKKFLSDLREMVHVAKWADDKRRQEAENRLKEIAGHLTGKIDDIRLNEIKTLCSQIWPVKTEEIMMTESDKPDRSRIYDGILKRSWVDQYYQEVEHVQQRFNFFLISTSFLLVS